MIHTVKTTILLLAIALLPFSAVAYDFMEDGIVYNIIDNKI